MRISSITATKTSVLSAGFFLLWLLAGTSLPEDCSEGKGLISNYINYLVGHGDTLLMVSGNETSLFLNMIAGREALKKPDVENNWWNYSLACKSTYMYDIVRGGSVTVATIDSAPNILWTYDHENSRSHDYRFPWPPADSSKKLFVVDGIWTADNFYFACLDGGMVRWNPDQDEKTVFFSDTQEIFDLAVLDSAYIAGRDTTHRITGIEILIPDSLLVVVTPAMMWRFSLADSSWDTIGAAFADESIISKEFISVYVNRQDSSLPLYSIAVITDDEDETMTVFCKYNRSSRSWQVMLDESPKALSFGPDGYIYTLFDEEQSGTQLRNIIRIYRDTMGDSGTPATLPPVEEEDIIHTRMRKKWNIDVPSIINDLLYIPRTDSTGYLWIATSEGLFFSPDEQPGAPGNDTSSFILIKRAPRIATGLKKTYARPGILGPSVHSCKFIYNITADSAQVTIRIYDYNNDLVKTVIENEIRSSGNNAGPLGRSTVESRDSWDGTDSRKRPVAPGVYYYKITTSSGERAFGKIVVAR